jgi:hypothetical protein
MKLDMRFRPGDDIRILWILVVVVLLGGSFYVQTRYQSAISESYDHSETLYRETVADNRIIGEAAVLSRIEKRAENDLKRVSHDTTVSASTANLLSTLHASAKRFRTSIVAVQPGTVPASTASESEPALQPNSLTLRLRGTFRDVLGFVEDLSHHATLLSVSDTEMSLANENGVNGFEPRLDATVHATLYRLRLPGDQGLRFASAR